MKLKNLKRKTYAKVCGTLGTVSMAACMIVPTYAADIGTDQMTQFVNTFIKPWLQLIGVVIALIGGVQFALGFQREDAEGKSRGLLTIMAGFMVAGIATATGIFI